MKPELIVALDNLSLQQALTMVGDLRKVGVGWFKVGLELYTLVGPEFILNLKAQGAKIFLDLKLFDIPNTVSKATLAAANLGVELLTIHCAGGPRMMEAARAASQGSSLKIVGVTVLTSVSETELQSMGKLWGGATSQSRSKIVYEYAKLAAESGLSGIVCSVPDLRAERLQELSWQIPPLFVVPGIRRESDLKNDQESIGTVSSALQAGATYLVVGRPITASKNPSQSAKEFLDLLCHHA